MKKIKLFDPFTGKEEETILNKVLKSGFWASGAGTGKVQEFEEKLSKYIGSDECISVNNGTAALHLALSLIDIKGKEVLLPSLSFVSTAHAVIYNGGKPVFVDIDEDTLCIDPQKIQKSITKKTCAILPVHFGGIPSKLDEIQSICKAFNLTLFEDAAHAIGSTYKNKKIGSHGTTVCFSFHPVKNLAMPSGGAIALNGRKTKIHAKKIKALRWCGITNRKGPIYDVENLGWNYYMNEFSAAIGIVQLQKLDLMNLKRKKLAKRYDNELQVEKKMPFNSDCSYHLYWIKVKNRNYFMKKMAENNIETGIHYKPIHQMKFYRNKSKLPITEETGKHIVTIPIHPNLTNNDIDRIILTVNKFS